MRSRPSWRFWLLTVAGALAQAAVVAGLLLVTRNWLGPLALLAAVAIPFALFHDRSLREMPERRRRGWALLGGVLALATSGFLVVLAFLVAWSISCEGGC